MGGHQYQNGKPYTDIAFNQVPTITPVPSVDPNNPEPNHDYTDPRTNCDPILVVNNNENIAKGDELTDLNVIEFSEFEFTEDQGTFTKWPSWINPRGSNINPVVRTIFEQPNQKVFLLNSFTVSGGKFIVKSGNVVLYIKNDFNYTGNGSDNFEIAAGATLTIYIEGRVIINNGITIPEPITAEGKAALSIFSSYETASVDLLECNDVDVGVELLSNASMHAAIYAPRAHIKVSSDFGSDFSGALRGKTVAVCGDGGIHYDKSLKNVSAGGGGSTQGTIKFLGWSYKVPAHAPEETVEEPVEPTI